MTKKSPLALFPYRTWMRGEHTGERAYPSPKVYCIELFIQLFGYISIMIFWIVLGYRNGTFAAQNRFFEVFSPYWRVNLSNVWVTSFLVCIAALILRSAGVLSDNGLTGFELLTIVILWVLQNSTIAIKYAVWSPAYYKSTYIRRVSDEELESTLMIDSWITVKNGVLLREMLLAIERVGLLSGDVIFQTEADYRRARRAIAPAVALLNEQFEVEEHSEGRELPVISDPGRGKKEEESDPIDIDMEANPARRRGGLSLGEDDDDEEEEEVQEDDAKSKMEGVGWTIPTAEILWAVLHKNFQVFQFDHLVRPAMMYSLLFVNTPWIIPLAMTGKVGWDWPNWIVYVFWAFSSWFFLAHNLLFVSTAAADTVRRVLVIRDLTSLILPSVFIDTQGAVMMEENRQKELAHQEDGDDDEPVAPSSSPMTAPPYQFTHGSLDEQKKRLRLRHVGGVSLDIERDSIDTFRREALTDPEPCTWCCNRQKGRRPGLNRGGSTSFASGSTRQDKDGHSKTPIDVSLANNTDAAAIMALATLNIGYQFQVRQIIYSIQFFLFLLLLLGEAIFEPLTNYFSGGLTGLRRSEVELRVTIQVFMVLISFSAVIFAQVAAGALLVRSVENFGARLHVCSVEVARFEAHDKCAPRTRAALESLIRGATTTKAYIDANPPRVGGVRASWELASTLAPVLLYAAFLTISRVFAEAIEVWEKGAESSTAGATPDAPVA